ncbi:MAG: single-stranded DNA-binding protein [Comamonadaceae bacterium]|nr:single-stranded DNA-binding protein [Comamonadaceae bacterium]
MIDGLVAGKVLGDPEQRLGKGDSRFVLAKVLAQAGDGEPLIVNVIAFDEAPRIALLELCEGDSVAVAGSLTPKAWTDKQGNIKPALDLVAHRVLGTHLHI